MINLLLTKRTGELYQDGILIPSEIQSLFPMGVFRIKCNLTATSRMKLNITRHRTSGMDKDIEEWFNCVGRYIQKKLYSGLISSIKELGVEPDDYDELLWNEHSCETEFEASALQSLSDIVRCAKAERRKCKSI